MKVILRWILLVALAFVIGLGVVLAFLAIQDSDLSSPEFQGFLLIFNWVAVWIGFGLYLKKDTKTAQPFACGFLAGLLASTVLATGFKAVFPSQQELLLKAQEAEESYFLLSFGSIDHGRICKAAIETHNLYKKAQDTEKTELFEYIVLRDRCL